MTTQRTRLSVPLFDRLVPRYRDMKPYEPVAPPERLQAESGVGKEGIVRLNANENPYGPPPRVREVIASFDAAHIYPDPDHAALRAGLARYTGFDVERIVAGSGSDELIALLVRLFVGPGDTIVTAMPTFGMYAVEADLAGARFVGVPRNSEDFSIDVPRLVEAARDAAIVFFSTPNNPTGNSVSEAEIRAIAETETLIVVDEAYAEFAEKSLMPLVDEYPNLIFLRTFSKWAGLAGLRVGYGIFPADLAAILMTVKPPYNVSTLAQVAAIAAIDDLDAAMATVNTIVRERAALEEALRSLPSVHVYPSDANFLLVRFLEHDAKELHAALLRRGIALRHFNTPELQDCIRISVGRPRDHERVLAALREEMEAQR